MLILVAFAYVVYEQGPSWMREVKDSLNRVTQKQSSQAASSTLPALPVKQKEPFKIKLTPIKKKIQVEVLNGCGEQGIAKILTERLRQKGYDVVNSGNFIEKGKTNFNVKKTKIIDQIKSAENITRARELADLMGVGRKQIESYENPSPIADLTIIIGKDFTELSILNKD